MGLYPITCFKCGKPFLWWSGNHLDQRCGDCQKKDPCLTAAQADDFFDTVDKIVNKTPLTCGHEPCTLGHCKGCKNHCPKKKKKAK